MIYLISFFNQYLKNNCFKHTYHPHYILTLTRLHTVSYSLIQLLAEIKESDLRKQIIGVEDVDIKIWSTILQCINAPISAQGLDSLIEEGIKIEVL